MYFYEDRIRAVEFFIEMGKRVRPTIRQTGGSRNHETHHQSPQAQERDEFERKVEALRREVRQLRLEQNLLNKANELQKVGLGVHLQLLSNREKTLLINALNEHYDLPELLGQLGLASSSYFYHRARAAVGDKLEVRQPSPRTSSRTTIATDTSGCRPR